MSNLSKSLYTRGLQCIKSLWLKKYKKEVLTPPNESVQAIFERGDEVGALACELFPSGVEIEFNPKDYAGMINTTKKLIDNGVKDIYEASFNFDNIFIAIDILHINEDNSVEIYEVKSSTDVKDVYLDDASIQYYVLKGLGYNIKKTSIVHINNKYVRGDELEIDKLFTIVDVSSEILDLQVNIPMHLKHFQNQLSKDTEPQIDIGKHCSYPYDCDAKEYCWKHIPDYSIFNISRLRADKKFDMYQNGIICFNQITNIDDFSDSQQIQIQSEQENKTIIHKSVIKEFLDGLSYPIYHLDFETFQQAIPKWKGIIPFMQIPFQFSLHIQEENDDLTHKEFLAIEGIDPRYELAKRLVNDIPADVTVLAYNMGFEKGVIRKLADMFDEFATHLMKIHDNIQDLMTPFQKKDYYTPSMKGSYSIKYVLPALVPDMAKAYTQLDYVQNGGDAMQTYPRLATMEDKEEVAKLRKALLRYCELDTLAMVKVLDKLKDSVR
jgi:hypothetical protein